MVLAAATKGILKLFCGAFPEAIQWKVKLRESLQSSRRLMMRSQLKKSLAADGADMHMVALSKGQTLAIRQQ